MVLHQIANLDPSGCVGSIPACGVFILNSLTLNNLYIFEFNKKMKLNILIGGKAGQGINKISEIISNVFTKNGYFVFNYRDYPSLIRGGHNFNVLTISDSEVFSNESKFDAVIAMDENSVKVHEGELKKEGVVFKGDDYKDLGRDLNIALASAYLKSIGISKEVVVEEVKSHFEHEGARNAVEEGYSFEGDIDDCGFCKRDGDIVKMTGSVGISEGAINSGIDVYLAYPMTPATGVLHDLASKQEKHGFLVFQPENEIAVANASLGCSFAGAKTMVGSSGGGYDLMTEALSMQGMAEIPLVVYLASRPGPGTGVPTYSLQDDLDVALRGGHGEFPRVVIAPGDPVECIENTNEAFYLSEKFGVLSIVLSDKHLAESEFSSDRDLKKSLKVEVKRKVPGEGIVKSSSYEHDKNWNTIEDAETAKEFADKRVARYGLIKDECKKFDMIKIHGKTDSKNLVIGWGSTKGAILDAIRGEDFKFLQVLYLKPLSDEIRKEIESANKIILVEQNVTGQLGRLIREKTGIKIDKRILRYDTRPFNSDELKVELLKI